MNSSLQHRLSPEAIHVSPGEYMGSGAGVWGGRGLTQRENPQDLTNGKDSDGAPYSLYRNMDVSSLSLTQAVSPPSRRSWPHHLVISLMSPDFVDFP